MRRAEGRDMDAQQEALGRALTVISELLEELAHIRAALPAPDESDEPGLAAGELRAAFSAARRPPSPARVVRPRPRWADVLAPGP